MKMENKGLLIGILACVIAIMLLGGYAMLTAEPVSVTNNPAPVITVQNVVYNDTAMINSIAKVEAKVYEDDNFEAEVEKISLAELTDDEYENLFDFMVSQNISIVEKEDISSVVIKDTNTNGIDVEEGQADVDFELKVYYEDADGDDKKVYIDVSYELDDCDVEDEIFALA